MKKLSKNELGFSAAEGILILVIIAIIGFAGWYVWHSKNNTNNSYNNASNSSSVTKPAAKKTTDPYAGWKTYSSADKAYTVSYPSNWVSDSCSVNNKCSNIYEIDNFLSPAAYPSWQVIWLSHTQTTLSPKQFFTTNITPTTTGTPTATNNNSINGYQTYYAETPGLNVYVIEHNGVEVSMQYVDVNGGGRNTVSYAPIFKQVANSIKFN